MDKVALSNWREALKGKPLFTSRNSMIFEHAGVLFKFYKPRHFISDYVRRYAGLSLARREAADYGGLRRIGLYVPRILGTKTLWNPLGRFESITALERLAGTITVQDYLQKSHDASRSLLLSNIAADLQRMWNAWVLHGDLRFGNILVGDDLVPYWLDPGLQRFRNYASMRKATDRVLGRFLRLNYRLIGLNNLTLFYELQLPKKIVDQRLRQPPSIDSGNESAIRHL